MRDPSGLAAVSWVVTCARGGRGRRTFDDRARDVQLVGHLDTRAGQGQQAALHDPRRELLGEVAHRGVRARQLGHRRPRGPSRRRVIGRIRRASRRARSVCAERSRRRYRTNDDPPGELDVHLPKACTSVARVAIGAGAVGRTAFSRLFPFFGDCASYERRRSLRRLKRLKRRSGGSRSYAVRSLTPAKQSRFYPKVQRFAAKRQQISSFPLKSCISRPRDFRIFYRR